ncbi:MAG TPA: MFS transporter [Candidatus Saccharimonadales bacterium]|nr:MFS transporter [Candidatus Saccharimonadales bacterium]
MNETAAKLSIGEKLGYSLGDTAANFIFQTMLVFQSIFYTDTFGITPGEVAALLLVVRVWDAVFDPLMGALADRTRTRWGKFRPWILWTAVPFGIMGFLTFTTPHFSHAGKLAYAYVTYIVLMMVYSANNLPYSALSGVMTGDIGERTSLSSYRFVFAMLAAFVVQGLAMPMVEHFGHGDNALGYQVTMGIFSTLCIIFFFITFLSTRERILPDPRQKSSLKQDFADLFHNGPWLTLFALTIFVFITLSMRGGDMLYYFKYYIDKDRLFAVLQSCGLAAAAGDPSGGTGLWHGFLHAFGLVTAPDKKNLVSVGFSLFNICGLGSTIIGIFFSKPLAMRFGKRNVFIGGLFATTVFTAVFVFLPPDAIKLAFGTEMLRQFSYGPTIPLLWAMMADVADYAEWKTGRRATGIIFSAIVFGLKAGLGIGGAIGTKLLSVYGYVPNAEQSADALRGIRLTASIFPAIPFFIGVICLFFYKIDKTLNIQISDELAERRKQYAPQTPLPEAP